MMAIKLRQPPPDLIHHSDRGSRILLPLYGSESGLREAGRLDPASSEKDPLEAMEALVLAGEDANAIGII
jgi:hypothetical protein